MGVFTEQVQGLVSEERTKRQERQQKEQEKQRKEDLKKHLYFILSSYFTEAKTEDYQDIYINLLKDKNKWNVINEITKKENEEYYLDINYTTILNKIKSSYIIQYKEYLKEEKEKEKIKLEEEKVPTTFEVVLSLIKCILFIIFIPILFFIMLFYYLLK